MSCKLEYKNQIVVISIILPLKPRIFVKNKKRVHSKVRLL